MYLKKTKASTDPRLRSLLQKAVRRGADHIVAAAIRRLIMIGDQAWLRSRAIVITFEEAWPLAKNLKISKDQYTKELALIRVAHTTKQKDAAGLGALAFAFHEGDHSMLDIVPSQRILHIISEGLNRPSDYFRWALSQCSSEDGNRVVTAAKEYLPAATWGWDKTTILAGAFLAASNEVPNLPLVNNGNSQFPYWVALDKHTPEGKEVFRKVAKKYKLSYRQLIWTSFYLESAAVNALAPSPWFEAEQVWRLRKAGLNLQAATDLWDHVRPIISAELFDSAETLRSQIETQDADHPKLFP
jgi:hypothetical protein